MRPTESRFLILLLVLPTAAFAAEVTWDTIIRLTTDASSQVGGYSGQRSIAVDGSEDVHVAWQDQRNPMPYKVWYRRYDAGTRIWQAETALTTRQVNCFQPSIACDGAGNVHLVWHIGSALGTGIWAKRYNAGTHHWRADTLIDSTSASNPQLYPSIACVPGTGDVAVAWYGLPDSGMYYQVFLKEWHVSTGWDSAMQISSAATSHDQASLAAGRNGDLAVVWVGRDFGNDYNQVYCRRRVGGVWQDVELVSDDPLSLSQYSPCVTTDERGRVHVVWHGRTMMNAYQQVFHRECDSAGWSGTDSVSGERVYQQQHPSVACDAAGRCHVVWCSGAGSDHTQLAYAQRDTGGVWSAPAILTGLDSGDVSYPSVACDMDSGIHVAWYDASSGNPDIYYLHGVMPGGGVTESRPLDPAVCRDVNAGLQSGSAPAAGCVVLDACGRITRAQAPGVYFLRAPGSAKLRRLVVVR